MRQFQLINYSKEEENIGYIIAISEGNYSEITGESLSVMEKVDIGYQKAYGKGPAHKRISSRNSVWMKTAIWSIVTDLQ